MAESPPTVAGHYGPPGLDRRVAAALDAAGLASGPLARGQIAVLDQLHPRGEEGTEAQAAAAGLAVGARVLDIGAGLGGPARFLAERVGCQAVALDMTPAFAAIGAALTARCGLMRSVTHVVGDGRRLPLRAGSFDAVWIQYALMNVADKPALLAEAFRVLRPGGRLVVGDVAAGNGDSLHFPLPWGAGPALTFLTGVDAFRSLALAAGFRVLACTDETAATLDWWRRMAARSRRPDAAPGRPGMGPHVVFGADAPIKLANLRDNFEDGRIREFRLVAERPA